MFYGLNKNMWKPQKKHKTWWFLWNTNGDIMGYVTKYTQFGLVYKKYPLMHRSIIIIPTIWWPFGVITPFSNTLIWNPRQIIHGLEDHGKSVWTNQVVNFTKDLMATHARSIVGIFWVAFCKKNITCNSWLMEPITSRLQQHLSFLLVLLAYTSLKWTLSKRDDDDNNNYNPIQPKTSVVRTSCWQRRRCRT